MKWRMSKGINLLPFIYLTQHFSSSSPSFSPLPLVIEYFILLVLHFIAEEQKNKKIKKKIKIRSVEPQFSMIVCL